MFSNFTFEASAAGSGATFPVDSGISLTPESSGNSAAIFGEQTQFSTGIDGDFVPEPASLMLLGTGALGLALLLRKRERWPV